MASQEPVPAPTSANPPSGPSLLTVVFGSHGFRVALLVLLIVSSVSLWLDPLFVDISKQFMDDNTARIAQGMGNEPTAKKMNAAIRGAGLSWCFVSDKAGKPLPAMKDLVPEGWTESTASKPVTLDAVGYYDSIAPLGTQGNLLHAGYRVQAGSWWAKEPLFSLVSVRVPLLYLFCAAIGAALLSLVFTAMNAAKMLKVRNAIPALFQMDEQSRNDFLARCTGAELSLLGESVRILMARYNAGMAESLKREHDLKKQFKKLNDENTRLHAEMKENLYQSHVSLSELTIKESEDDFLRLVQKDIQNCKDLSDVFQKTLDLLHSKYPTSLTYCSVVTIRPDRRVDINAQIGFDASLVLGMIKNFDAQAGLDLFSSTSAKQLSEADFERFGLEELARQHGWHSAIMIPVVHPDRHIALMMAFFDESTKKSMQDRVRVLKSVSDVLGTHCNKLIAYNEEQAAARTDSLTGTYNKKYFLETFAGLIKKSSADHPLTVLMVDGDKFKAINDTYGHQIGDAMLKELAATMQASTRRTESQKSGRFKDHVIRYGGEEFMIVLENTNKETAMMVAERLRKTVAEKQNWPGGIAKWTISIGVASFPNDSTDANELIEKADIALYYCKEVLGRNAVADFNSLPKNFRGKKKATLGGELGVLEPAALLQSLATAQKTGVMTVIDAKERTFWYFCQAGRPAQARLGSLAGDNAVVEFIATFEEGRFNFQERADGGQQRALDESFDVKRSLERCLMDGALAVDNMQWGMQLLSSLPSPISLCPAGELKARLDDLLNAPGAAIMPNEVEMIQRVYPLVQEAGVNPVQICAAVPDVPSYLVIRALGLMCQAGILGGQGAPEMVAQTT